MAIKTVKDKVKGSACISNVDKEKNVVKIVAPIDERESVMLYGSEVIYTERDKDNPPYSLQDYQGPQFIMCPPFGMSNGIANNEWMNEEDDGVERFIAHEEWLKLYKDLSSIGMVYLLQF